MKTDVAPLLKPRQNGPAMTSEHTALTGWLIVLIFLAVGGDSDFEEILSGTWAAPASTILAAPALAFGCYVNLGVENPPSPLVMSTMVLCFDEREKEILCPIR